MGTLGGAARNATLEADAALDAEIDALARAGQSTGQRLDALVGAQTARVERLVDERNAHLDTIRAALETNAHFSSVEALRVARDSGVTSALTALIDELDARTAAVDAAARRLEVVTAARRSAAADPARGGVLDPDADPDAAGATAFDALIDHAATAQDQIARLTLSRLDQVNRAEQRALVELATLRDGSARNEVAYQHALTVTQQRFAAERTRIQREAAGAEAADREREAREREQAEKEHLDRRLRLIGEAASAQAAVEQQLQSGRDTLATPFERATAAIDRWETAARRAVALRRETAEALAQGRPDAALHAAAAAAEAEADYTRITVISAERRANARETEAQRALAASRRWQDGAIRGLQAVHAQMQDFASLSENAVTGAFRGMEDTLASFVATGKLRFSDLAQSIIADLARIAIRQSITPALFDGLTSFFGAPDGGLGGGAVPGPHVGHTGGIAGALRTHRTGIPDAAWLGAPRFHGGGIPGLTADEIPVIVRRDEGIFTPEQMRALGTGGAPQQIDVRIDNRGTPLAVQQAAPRLDADRLVIDIVTDDIARGGRIARVLASQGA